MLTPERLARYDARMAARRGEHPRASAVVIRPLRRGPLRGRYPVRDEHLINVLRAVAESEYANGCHDGRYFLLTEAARRLEELRAQVVALGADPGE